MIYKDNPGFIIVDAGGGTVDISAYRQKPGDDTSIFEEIAPSQCQYISGDWKRL